MAGIDDEQAGEAVDVPLAGGVEDVVAFAAGVGVPAEFRGLVFGEILVFIVVLAAAYAYAWRKGVFTWR